MKGSVPRPCFNGCGVQIYHGIEGGTYAWIESGSGKRHRCAVRRVASKPKSQRLPNGKADRAGIIEMFSKTLPKNVQVIGKQVYMARGVFFPVHIKTTGEHYRPYQHRDGCNALPWEDCKCPT